MSWLGNVETGSLDRPPPSVSVLSLNITCVFNSDTHVNEIVAVTGLFHNDVAVDSPTDQTDPTEAFSIVRPLSGGSWPPDLIATIAHNVSTIVTMHPVVFNSLGLLGLMQKLPITCSPSERALLSLMLARLHALDPDVIVGHGLFGYAYILRCFRNVDANVWQCNSGYCPFPDWIPSHWSMV